MGEEKFEEIQNSGYMIPVKIGCDGGQGFLKWSTQLLEVSANSVSNLMILCVVDIPETTSNLRTLAEFPLYQIYIYITFLPIKVANIITSITHGCYTCIYCTWRKSEGINFDNAEPRTAELQSSLVTELQERNGGNKKKSKFVRGVNGIPVFPSIDALHLFCPPELHLLLGIVKRLYDKIITKMDGDAVNQHQELLRDHSIYLDPRNGGEFQGNSARHLLNSLNSLGFPKRLTFECFQSFRKLLEVVSAPFEMRLC